MSGFVAVISAPRHPVRDQEIERLASAYESVRGPGERHTASGGDQVRLVKFDLPSSGRPGIEWTGRSWGVAVGTVYPQRSLLGARLEELDGQFALLTYDADQKEVVIASDPFGMQPLYVAERDGAAFVSTSAMAIAKSLGSPASHLGLTSYVRTGYHFGAATHWEGIRRLDPAICIRYRNGRATETCYWRPEVDRTVNRLDFEGALGRCLQVSVETFRQYLAPQGPTWADLSGGFDTRLICVLLAEAGVPFIAETRETRLPEDAIIASDVARAGGWDWLRVAVPREWETALPELVPVSLGWADGTLDAIDLARFLSAHRILASGPRSILNGVGGGHFRGHSWRQEFTREGRSNRINMDRLLDMRMIHPMDTSIFRVDPTRDIREDSRARLLAWGEPYRDELDTVQLDVLHAYKMMGHGGAYCAADAAFLRAELPFYYKPLFTTAFSVDFRHRNQHKLMRHMIEALDPRVAAVRTETGGPAQAWRASNFYRFIPYYAKIGRKAANKLGEKATGRSLLAPKPVVLPGIATGVSSFLRRQHLRAAEMRSGSLYDARTLDRLLTAAERPGARPSDLVGRIVTAELALRAAGSTLGR